jgi:hypothetical protein
MDLTPERPSEQGKRRPPATSRPIVDRLLIART